VPAAFRAGGVGEERGEVEEAEGAVDFGGGAIGDGEGGALGGFELAVFDAGDADVAGAAACGVDEEEAEEA
jgi:hypothetical protein